MKYNTPVVTELGSVAELTNSHFVEVSACDPDEAELWVVNDVNHSATTLPAGSDGPITGSILIGCFGSDLDANTWFLANR